jgi:Protein of unknown function (DUF2612)
VSGPPCPQYPAGTGPGQNSIGQFVIGVSPIGDIPAWDPWVQIISQYANSDRIDNVIQSFNDAMEQTLNIENLYDFVWNIQTAVGYGLDVLGRIVNVKRTIPISGSATYLGNEEAGSWTGFGQGILFSGGNTTTNFTLSDSDYRTLIYAKAASNITDGSIPSVNQILLTLFPGRGACFVADGLNMSVTYTFQFALNPVELAIVQFAGVLPTAAGVTPNISFS